MPTFSFAGLGDGFGGDEGAGRAVAGQDLVNELGARAHAGLTFPVAPEVFALNVGLAAEGALESLRDVQSAEEVRQTVELFRSRSQLNSGNRIAKRVHQRMLN